MSFICQLIGYFRNANCSSIFYSVFVIIKISPGNILSNIFKFTFMFNANKILWIKLLIKKMNISQLQGLSASLIKFINKLLKITFIHVQIIYIKVWWKYNLKVIPQLIKINYQSKYMEQQLLNLKLYFYNMLYLIVSERIS